MASATPKPEIITIAFAMKTEEARRAFLAEIRERFDFLGDGDVGVRAFAMSSSDMFAEQDAIDAIMESDLDSFEKLEAIGEVPNSNLPALFERWQIASRKAA